MALNYLTNTQEVQVAVKGSGSTLDVSQLCQSVSWHTFIQGQAGVCNIDLAMYNDAMRSMPEEGGTVTVRVKGEDVFKGFIFTRSYTDDEVLRITAYDGLRYLNATGSWIFQDQSFSDILGTLCSDVGISFSDNSGSSGTISPKIWNGASYWAIINHAIEEVLYRNNKLIVMRSTGANVIADVAGKGDLNNTDVIIGDGQLLTGYSFSSSIDNQTYTRIRVYCDTQTDKEELVAEAEGNTGEWGVLQKSIYLNSGEDSGQVDEIASTALDTYNRKRRTLTLEALGNPKVTAGSGIQINISDLEREGLSGQTSVICYDVEHTVTDELHKMTLQVYVPD